MIDASRRPVATLLIVAVALCLWRFFDTYAALVGVWHTNSTFSHGFLIVPIVCWLAWRNRARLLAVDWRPSWLGVVASGACALLWVAARGSGVAGAEQFAAVAMLPSVFLAVMGVAAARTWIFPLGFLMFAVPVGHALVPMLMQFTADIATLALRLTGIPVVRSYMHISVPAGDFEVAKACSGLNYLVTGFVLGVLYSYLTYESWRKRLFGVLAFIVIPIVANGLRVYFTILVSHLTNMRYGPGEEHVLFGKVFFILVVVLMFWIGRRWQDPHPAPMSPVRDPVRPVAISPFEWAAVALALAPLLLAPAYLDRVTSQVEQRLALESSQLQLPAGRMSWSGPEAGADGWRPLYSGARVERAATYVDSIGGRVDAYVGVYGIGTSGGAEMVTYQNRIANEDNVSLMQDGLRAIELDGGTAWTVRKQVVRTHGVDYLVWHWFVVGDRVEHSRSVVKVREALAFLTGGAVIERIVTVATPVGAGDEQRLEAFAKSTGACLKSGFAFEACSG